MTHTCHWPDRPTALLLDALYLLDRFQTNCCGEFTIPTERVERLIRDIQNEVGELMHTCHWPHCPISVPPSMWGCAAHWRLIPYDLRQRIWRTYRPGQEIDKRPSAEYIEAANAVQDWIYRTHLADKINPRLYPDKK